MTHETDFTTADFVTLNIVKKYQFFLKKENFLLLARIC